jgi:hypothetical protein
MGKTQNKCCKCVTRADAKMFSHGLALRGIQSHSGGNFLLALRDIDDFQVALLDFLAIPSKHRAHIFDIRHSRKREDNQTVLVSVNIERLSQRRIAEERHHHREKSETPATRNLTRAIRSSGQSFHLIGFPDFIEKMADDLSMPLD